MNVNFNPQNKEMTVFSIPFCHLSHPGNKLFVARGSERKGAREVRLGGDGEAANGSPTAGAGPEAAGREERAVGKTEFQEGDKNRGFSYSGSIEKKDKRPGPPSLDPEGSSELATLKYWSLFW